MGCGPAFESVSFQGRTPGPKAGVALCRREGAGVLLAPGTPSIFFYLLVGGNLPFSPFENYKQDWI